MWNNFWRISAPLLSVALCLGLLTGCGGDAGRAANAGDTPAATGAESAGEAAATDTQQSREYHEQEDAYADLSFSIEPGIYTDPITIQVLGANGANIYYTINGYDPLVYDGKVRLDGELLDESGIQLSDGAVELKIRAVNPETLEVSPLYSVNYTVKVPFDTTSDLVNQDSYYDYILRHTSLYRWNVWTEEEEMVYNDPLSELSGLCITTELTTPAIHYGEDYGDSLSMPEARLHWKEHKDDLVESTMVTFKLDRTKEMVYSYSVGGKLGDWENSGMSSNSYHVGNGAWCVGRGQAFWFDDMQEPVATEETVLWCQLLTDEVALRAENINGAWTLLARDPNGENERVLITSETEIYLDAIIRQRVLYHVGEDDDTVHMVYELDSGKAHENFYLNKGEKVLGYTTRNIYCDGTTICNYDYEALSLIRK